MIHWLLIIFIFGTIVGSFLNVVILRHNTGRPIFGRISTPGVTRSAEWRRVGLREPKFQNSFCMSCSKPLSWYELIPIVSFIIQRGRCRACGSRISIQYPLVEFITGLAFALIFWKFGAWDLVGNWKLEIGNLIEIIYFWLIFSILIIISVYDVRHKIIPNKFVYIFIILSLFSPLIGQYVNTSICQLSIVNCFLNHILAGLTLALPLALIWLFSRGRLMGFGDAKLALGIGFLLGLSKGAAALILAFWIGAAVSIILILLSRVFAIFHFRVFSRLVTIKSEVPFGPFLALATFIVFLFDINIITLINIFTY